MEIYRQNASAKYEWDFYKEGVEGRNEFILVYGKRMYFTIPKASFPSENEVETFRNMLKTKLSNFKQKLKIPLDNWMKVAT